MKKNNIDDTSEEKFLKNKARRTKSISHTDSKGKSDKERKLSPGKITLYVFLSLLALLILVVTVIFFKFDGCSVINAYFFDTAIVDDNSDNDKHTTNSGQEVERDYINVEGNSEKKNYTFLATATDKAGSLTDVIMIANYTNDTNNPKVSILQIPRDTYVKISAGKLHLTPGGELSEDNFTGSKATTAIKINEAYYRGKNLASSSITSLLKEVDGKSESQVKSICKKSDYKFLNVDVDKVIDYASSTDKSERKELENNIRCDFGLYYLQQLLFCHFRIPIDFTAQVNIKGFRGIVDAVGGVDLYVPQNMDYDDPFQDLHIHIKKGQQHLDGKKAEGFVRYRQYALGDIQRLDAQKIFIDAFLDKILSPSTITKIDDIIEEIDKNLYTSVSLENMVRFGKRLLNINPDTGFEMMTLPGIGQYVNGISYFVCDKQATVDLINEKFNLYGYEFSDDDFNMIDGGSVPKSSAPVWNDDDEDEKDVDSTVNDKDKDEEKDEQGDIDREENKDNENQDVDDENQNNDNPEDENNHDDNSEDENSSDEKNPDGENNDGNVEDENANEPLEDEPSEDEPKDDEAALDNPQEEDVNGDNTDIQEPDSNEEQDSVPEDNSDPQAEDHENPETSEEPSDNSYLLEQMAA